MQAMALKSTRILQLRQGNISIIQFGPPLQLKCPTTQFRGWGLKFCKEKKLPNQSGFSPGPDSEVLISPKRLDPEVQQVHLYSSLSPTCLKPSPTFAGEVLSLSLVGFESKS